MPWLPKSQCSEDATPVFDGLGCTSNILSVGDADSFRSTRVAHRERSVVFSLLVTTILLAVIAKVLTLFT